MIVTTSGLVQRLTISESGFVCAYIGPTMNNAELVYLRLFDGDSTATLTWKNGMTDALVAAQATGKKVWVTHDQGDAVITSVSLGGPLGI